MGHRQGDARRSGQPEVISGLANRVRDAAIQAYVEHESDHELLHHASELTPGMHDFRTCKAPACPAHPGPMAGEPARWPAPWHPPNDIAPWRIFVAVDASEDKKAEKPKVGYAIGVYCLPGTNDDTPVLPGDTALGPWAECEDAPTLLYAWVQRLPPRYGYDPPNNTVAEGLAACGAFDMFAEGTPISVWSDAQIWHTAWKRLIEDR